MGGHLLWGGMGGYTIWHIGILTGSPADKFRTVKTSFLPLPDGEPVKIPICHNEFPVVTAFLIFFLGYKIGPLSLLIPGMLQETNIQLSLAVSTC